MSSRDAPLVAPGVHAFVEETDDSVTVRFVQADTPHDFLAWLNALPATKRIVGVVVINQRLRDLLVARGFVAEGLLNMVREATPAPKA